MAGSRQVRLLFTAMMNVLIIVVVVLVIRLVIEFFGTLAAREAGSVFLSFTDFLVPDLGIMVVRTPYGGVFDATVVVVIIALLLMEWALATVRSRA